MKEVEKQLERIREMQLEIDEICEQIVTIRKRATNISQTFSDVPKTKGKVSSKVETAVFNICMKAHKMEHTVSDFLTVRELAENDITSLIKDRRKQTVLKSRYIYNYSWKKIAQMMKLSLSQVHKHKHIALDVLEKIFDNETK